MSVIRLFFNNVTQINVEMTNFIFKKNKWRWKNYETDETKSNRLWGRGKERIMMMNLERKSIKIKKTWRKLKTNGFERLSNSHTSRVLKQIGNKIPLGMIDGE